MTRTQIETLTNKAIDKYLINHPENRSTWSFRFTDSKSSPGWCEINREEELGEIALSKYLIGKGREIVEETLYHEIAHGIDYIENYEVGHGDSWKRIMIRIGQDPSRFISKGNSKKFKQGIQYKYTGVCPVCENVWSMSRMGKRAKANMKGTYICKGCTEALGREVFISFKQNY